jgi:hypothetical protein
MLHTPCTAQPCVALRVFVCCCLLQAIDAVLAYNTCSVLRTAVLSDLNLAACSCPKRQIGVRRRRRHTQRCYDAATGHLQQQ